MAREIFARQPYIAGFLEMMGDSSDVGNIVGTLQGLLEGGDFEAFHTHLLASLPPIKERRHAQIVAALETNLLNGKIFFERGENPRHSLQQALNCYKALVGID